MTLNRLIAGDFLESLGKELGLEVPDTPLSSRKPDITEKETSVRDSRNERSSAGEQALSSGQGMVTEIDSQSVSATVVEVNHSESLETQNEILHKDYSFGAGVSPHSGQKAGEVGTEKTDCHSKRHTTHSGQNRSTGSSSDADSSRDHKCHRQRRSKAGQGHGSSDTESSDDERGGRSRSKRKKSSSHRSKKHSKHHGYKSRQSPTGGSTRGTGGDHPDYSRDNRSSREHGSRRRRH